VEVTVTELRAHLREWLGRARAGEDVVITERGVPVARLSGIDSMDVIERLTREGVLSPPASKRRHRAAGRPVPRPTGSVSELVSEMRR